MTYLIHWEPWQQAIILTIIMIVAGCIIGAKISAWLDKNH